MSSTSENANSNFLNETNLDKTAMNDCTNKDIDYTGLDEIPDKKVETELKDEHKFVLNPDINSSFGENFCAIFIKRILLY